MKTFSAKPHDMATVQQAFEQCDIGYMPELISIGFDSGQHQQTGASLLDHALGYVNGWYQSKALTEAWYNVCVW